MLNLPLGTVKGRMRLGLEKIRGELAEGLGMSANEHDARLEEAVAFALGSLDPEQAEDFEEHPSTCKRCQEESAWLGLRGAGAARGGRAAGAATGAESAPDGRGARRCRGRRAARQVGEARKERAAAGGGFSAWLGGLRVGSLTWKPIAGLALVILVVAGGIGYSVGTGGSGSGNTHTWELKAEENAGIAAKVVREGEKGQIHLAGLTQLPRARCSRPG